MEQCRAKEDAIAHEAHQKKVIADLKWDLNEANKRMEEKSKQLEDADKRLEDVDKTIAKDKETIAQDKQTIAEKDATIAQLQAKNETINTLYSWLFSIGRDNDVKRAASDPKLLDLLFEEYKESHNN